MICPVCQNELKKGHQAADYYVLYCSFEEKHYSILIYKSSIENETFIYNINNDCRVVVQKIYFHDREGFFWSIRKDKVVRWSQETLCHFTLNEQEFLNKFGEFNSNNIQPILKAFEIYEVFK